jgi:hypothetical protein
MNPIFHCASCIVLCVCEQPRLDKSRAAAIGLIGFRPVMQYSCDMYLYLTLLFFKNKQITMKKPYDFLLF